MPRIDRRTGLLRSASDQDASPAPIRFPPDNFKHSLTLFSKSFSSLPRGTCSLSVSRPYLALDGIYRPIGAAFPNNPTVGSLPDGMAFSPDGSRLVVANEGEIDGNKDFVLAGDKSNDPLGTISIIAIANGTPADTAQSLDFTAFDNGGARASERPSEVRIGIAGNDFSRDAEPEYVTITADGSKAYVTLQENNAVAIVDLASARIERIVALGFKNHGLAVNALAPSDKVSATAPFALKSYANLFGIYMPDAIASFSIGNTPYFITANEAMTATTSLPPRKLAAYLA